MGKNNHSEFKIQIEDIVDAVFIAELKSRKLVDCNKKAEKLTGYSREEILSMRADNLHPPHLVAKTMSDFEKIKRGIST